MREMSPVEAAWLAGLIEGEGCITTHRGGWRLTVEMTDEDVVLRCQTLTGVGVMTPMGQPRTNRKPTYRWNVHKRDHIAAVLRQVAPLMGQRRAARIAEFVAWYEGPHIGRVWGPTHGQGVHPGGCARHPGAGRYGPKGKCRECGREHQRRWRAKRREAAVQGGREPGPAGAVVPAAGQGRQDPGAHHPGRLTRP